MPELARTVPSATFETGDLPIDRCGWVPAAGPLPPYAPLDHDLEADAVVVGAGLTGASMALRLAQRGMSVVLLEARQPADAASGRNAGHVLPCLGSLRPLASWPDQGARFLEYFVTHRRIVYDLCAEHGIDGDAAQVGCLEMAHRPSRPLAANAARWRRLGCDVEIVEGSALEAMTGTSKYRYALHWRDGGRVNPYLFTQGLVRTAARLGTRVFGDSRVVAAARAGDRWELRTARGAVRAPQVILCTNGHRGNVYRPELAATGYPLTACGLATEPLPPAVLAAVNPSRAALQQVPTGLYPLVIDGRGRLITATIPDVGGATDAGRYFRRLLRYLRRTYPDAPLADLRLESYWTGLTHSSSPVHHEDYPQLYDLGPGMIGILNLGTWGNVLGPLVGRNVADALREERPQDIVLPLESPVPLGWPGSFAFKIRYLLMPLARTVDLLGLT